MKTVLAALLLSCSIYIVNAQQPIDKPITYHSTTINKARENLGKNVSVFGIVNTVKLVGNKVFVDLGYPGIDESITVVLTGNPTTLANKIKGKKITFLGTLLMQNGKLQMKVKNFGQVIYNSNSNVTRYK